MKHIFRYLVLAVLAGVFFACEKDDEVVKSSEKQIKEFSIVHNKQLIKGAIDGAAFSIEAEVPASANVSALATELIISDKATVKPASGNVQDFSAPITYTVTAEDGTTQAYKVTVTKAAIKNADILSFSVDGAEGTIDQEVRTIEVEVPATSDLTKLKPVLTISDEATVTPASGAEVDCSSPVSYTVTNKEGDSRIYTLTVNRAKRTENNILTFKFEAFNPVIEATINESDQTISAIVPWDADFDIYSMIPTLTLSEGATVDPGSGVEQSFKVAREYTVTAESGDTRIYTVNVTVEEAPEATVEALTVTQYSKGSQVSISGTNLTDCSVSLRGASTHNVSVDDLSKTKLVFTVPSYSSLTPGDYTLVIIVRGKEFDLGIVNILPPAPSITSMTKAYDSFDGNTILTINGSNFSTSGNEVYFENGNTSYKTYLKSEAANKIQAAVPHLLASGNYNVKVVSQGGEVISTETIAVTENTSADLIISGVDKTTVARGSKLVIYGKNFEEGVSYVGFMDGWSSTKTITGTRLSDTEYELTIPADFKAATYEFYIQGFGTESNLYYNLVITE